MEYDQDDEKQVDALNVAVDGIYLVLSIDDVYHPRVLRHRCSEPRQRVAIGITRLQQYLNLCLERIHSGKPGILSFDELGVQQLRLSGTLMQNQWDLVWLGPEFSHSMFIDAVTGMFYPSSTEREHGVSWNTQTVLSYFKKNHVKDINRNRQITGISGI